MHRPSQCRLAAVQVLRNHMWLLFAQHGTSGSSFDLNSSPFLLPVPFPPPSPPLFNCKRPRGEKGATWSMSLPNSGGLAHILLHFSFGNKALDIDYDRFLNIFRFNNCVWLTNLTSRAESPLSWEVTSWGSWNLRRVACQRQYLPKVSPQKTGRRERGPILKSAFSRLQGKWQKWDLLMKCLTVRKSNNRF